MFTVAADNGTKILELQSIHDRLEEIRVYLEKEINFKQTLIDGQQTHITQLKSMLDEKDTVIQTLENQLEECKKTNEGTRQLINKLLNDISKHQQNIEWYKRTYEKRSLPGTIWQKLFRNRN